MSSIQTWFGRWFGGSPALSESSGVQTNVPAYSLVVDAKPIGPDGALQLSAVWACIDRRATTIASLPFFAYERQEKGHKTLARGTRLYSLLHESPNSRMTPMEFWRAMILNHDFRGNAYARIDRNAAGEAVALWPMPADQVQEVVLDDGSMMYKYQLDGAVAVFSDANVLHLKNLGNGTTGLSKLEYMRGTADEQAKAINHAARVFGTGGKPTGVLMIDKTLTADQREKVRAEFQGLQTGDTARLVVLEAAMKYEQLSLSPQDQQLLETRKFGVEEICRWFDVPPVLIHHSNVTAWGSGIEQLVDGFYKLSIRPMLVAIEQAVTKRVMTPKQRATMSVEFNFDALLRGNLAQRYDSYAKGVQNGVLTRNEVRQYENMPPVDGGDELTAQVNLAPLTMLGQVAAGASNAGTQDTQLQ